MLEITGNEIAELSDSDLRALIGLLCEAELYSKGLPTAGVTWGGHQDARDGGIDVRVSVTTTLDEDSFVPRSNTGFQVKKPDMPRSAIINEMRPSDELRQVIKGLADVGGAYVIVSAQGSTADSALADRKEAMNDALSDYSNAANIKVDFYDRERVAGWVRSHASLVLWVRDKIGQPIQGWKTYGNWAYCPGGLEEQYILDDHIRIRNTANLHSEGVCSKDGINELRSILHRPASSIRLVGLSGVGKTRLLQALFDERIGEHALNRFQVFYCDVGDNPNPDPRNFAERLIALQKPAILAVDNCPPDLHKRLTSVCSASGSLVSLITVEYDVRDDQPEETEVFYLEPASSEIIINIIRTRFEHVSEIDARTIAEFSGGNARIAIALASTIQQGEDLANLRDEDLFIRLFQQRNSPDRSLLKAAEVCSLVYSFDCRTSEGDDIELRLLGSLTGMSVDELYENVSELKRRNLIQQRSVWRAVLPQAIANRLAKRALENIPENRICDVFEKRGLGRLLKSFSRRLGYLHECDAAKEISRRWFSEEGLLGDVTCLNEIGINLFENIAPVDPELTLSVIEKVVHHEDAESFFSRDNSHYTTFTRILRSIAYDKDLFERSVGLLCRFALSESPRENNDSIRDLLETLFYIHLSGTHATPEQRLNVISQLIYSNTDDQIDLGISLLGASLKTWHFSVGYGFEFGAWSRDFGFVPRSKQEFQHWFVVFTRYCLSVISNQKVVPKIKSLLAEHFRGLWTKAELYDELEEVAQEISNQGSWKEAWIAVRTIKRYDGNTMDPEVYSRLDNLDKLLKPTTLLQRAKLYALSGYGHTLDLVDTVEDEDEYLAVEQITQSLGREVGTNYEVFKELLPDILSKDGARIFTFGQGLANGGVNPEQIWQDFCQQLTLIEEDLRIYQVMRGFLNGISRKDTNLSEELLNKAVTDKVLAVVFPLLQTSVEIMPEAVERLKKSLEYGEAPIRQYQCLAYGRAHETINDDDLCELLSLISSQEGGVVVSAKILQMRLHAHRGETLGESIIFLGQELLLKYQFAGIDNCQIDYVLAEIVRACLVGEAAEDNAKTLCKNLCEAYTDHSIYSSDYDHVVEALAATQPEVFLESFLSEDVKSYSLDRIFRLPTRVNPMAHIDDDIIVGWCEQNPETRYPKVASVIIPFRRAEQGKSLEWTPLAQTIINNFYDPSVILNEFKSTFRPTTWSGSRADILQSRICLIQELKEHEHQPVVDWAIKEEKKFEKEIQSEREWEMKRETDRNERFE